MAVNWKQLVLTGNGPDAGAGSPAGYASRRVWAALGLAVAAAAVIKAPALFGIAFDDEGLFYPLNMSFFILPFLVAYFAWERPVAASDRLGLAAVFVVAAVVVNAFPFDRPAVPDTAILTTLHRPIALWLVVGAAYVGGRWWGRWRCCFRRYSRSYDGRAEGAGSIPSRGARRASTRRSALR